MLPVTVLLALLAGPARADDAPGPMADDELRDLVMVALTAISLSDYAFPERIQPVELYFAALASLERRVPAITVHRLEGDKRVQIDAGAFSALLDVPVFRGRELKDVHAGLVDAMSFIADHIEPDDVPVGHPATDRRAQMEYALVNGMLQSLDPNSALLTPDHSRDFEDDTKGEVGGVGLSVVMRDERLTVDYPLPGMPAGEAGVQANDRILRIDGVSTLGMSFEQAVGRLRGPIGTKVKLELERGAHGDIIEAEVQRARLELDAVEHTLLAGRVGYIRVPGFNANTGASFAAALASLPAEAGRPVRGLVLDLRGNPGGLLREAYRVGDALLRTGEVVSTVRGTGQRDEPQDAVDSGDEPDYPVVVLQDAMSASAAEIVAAALRENGRAVIVGEPSFGKGSVQTTRRLARNEILKLTVARYEAGGYSVHGVGVPVDVHMIPVLAETEGEQVLAVRHARSRALRLADIEAIDPADRAPLAPAAHVVPYWRPLRPPRRTGPGVLIPGDVEVELARQIVLAAKGGTRAEVLEAIEGPVAAAARAGEAAIIARMNEVGIDWSAGPTIDHGLEVSVETGADGLKAGGEAEMFIVVHNRGDRAAHRLVVQTTSDLDALDDRELVFGRVEPGQSLRKRLPLRLRHGTGDGTYPLSLTIRGDLPEVLASDETTVRVIGNPLPSLAWQWSVEGPDTLAAGARLTLAVSVTNVGEGAALSPTLQLSAESWGTVDLEIPSVELETIEPGATATGRLEVVLREPAAEGWALELGLLDAEAYDATAVRDMELRLWIAETERIVLEPGALPAPSERIQPPTITLSAGPQSTTSDAVVRLSGVARDDGRIAGLMVFHDDDKVLGQTAATGWMPFSTDLWLEPGINRIAVVAVDDRGAHHTRSMVVLRRDSGGE